MIWAAVILVTFLIVLIIWGVYEATQDCWEEEDDISAYQPIFIEEEEFASLAPENNEPQPIHEDIPLGTNQGPIVRAHTRLEPSN